jgi:hypothetical protein
MSDDDDDDENKGVYCGVKRISKNKRLGTPDECAELNQVRHYGLEKIDKNLVNISGKKPRSLIKEQLKEKKLEMDGRVLLKEANTLKIIIEDDRISEKTKKKSRKRLDELKNMSTKLVKKLKEQKKVINEIKQDELVKQTRENNLKKKQIKKNKPKKSKK